MRIIPYTKLWLSFSFLLVVASVAVFFVFGLRLSSDFTEGTLLALRFHESQSDVSSTNNDTSSRKSDETSPMDDSSLSLTKDGLRKILNDYVAPTGQKAIGSIDIKLSTDSIFIIKTRRLSEAEQGSVLGYLRDVVGSYDLIQSRDVSPLYAKTFRDKALLAIAVASIMIILYITFAFRRVSRGIQSWKLGFAAIVALIHDLVVIVGVFVLLGYFYHVEIDVLFITALLSVLGFSVNDTIVVFDRVRENLLIKHHNESFDEVAEKSLQQTLARSINTSFSTLLVLLSLLFFGAYEIFYFVLALTLGVVVGTYSSIFLATPLLTLLQRKNR